MKKVLLALLLALCLLCLSGCQRIEVLAASVQDTLASLIANKAEQSGADALTRQFIDGLLTNDPQKSHAVFYDGLEMSSLLEVFPQMQSALPDADSYTLTPVSWNVKTDKSETYTTIQFLLTVSDEQFVVETLLISGIDGLYSINIGRYIPDEAAANTVVTESGQYSTLDLAFLLLSVATALFVLWALVDCCRHRIRRKWLWVLLILLGNVLLLLTLDGGKLNLRLQLGLYLNASAFKMRDGGFYLSLLLPVGSIVYLACRKHLHIPQAQRGFAEAFQDETFPADQTNTK